MKTALRHIMAAWMSNTQTAQSVEHIIRLKNDKGWQAFVNLILFLKAHIREAPLSKEFQKLDIQKKESLLQSYAWMDEFLDWAMNPLGVIETQERIRVHNLRQEQKLKPKSATMAS